MISLPFLLLLAIHLSQGRLFKITQVSKPLPLFALTESYNTQFYFSLSSLQL